MTDYGDDHYDQYKDDLAMGRIYEDGSYREPDEPDWGALDEQRHSAEAHGGKACDCPPPDPVELPEGETYDMEAPF